MCMFVLNVIDGISRLEGDVSNKYPLFTVLFYNGPRQLDW